MIQPNFRLLGRGVYTIYDAYRLTEVPLRSIRRWTAGYRYVDRGKERWSAPVIRSELRGSFDAPVLDFADLLEIRFLHAFRELGVGWKAIRVASERARDLLRTNYPFSSRKFSTDGHTILAQIGEDAHEDYLLDLVKDQIEFKRLIKLHVRGEVTFGLDNQPTIWRPDPVRRSIVVDPRRSFGAPIVDKEGVRTEILALSAQAEESIEAAAALFEVDPISVAEAVEFELSRPR